MENDNKLSADEMKMEEKQQKTNHCKAKTNGTAVRPVTATAALPLSNTNASQFNQTGICLLNINGVVLPAILPLDKVNNGAIISNATGSNTKISQLTPTRIATPIANGARNTKTSTISQANDSVCPTESDCPYRTFTKTTKGIVSNCTVAKQYCEIMSCPSSNLASHAHTCKSTSQTAGNVAAKSRATRSSTRDQVNKGTAKGARERQKLGCVASRSTLFESAGNLGLKKMQSPESSCKSNICGPQSQASEDEVEKRGKHLIDVLSSGNAELPSASQLDITKVSTMMSCFFILMKTL